MKKLMKTLATITLGCAVFVTTGVHVRADAPPGHFTDVGDGTVRDNATGLVWQQGFSPSGQSQTASIIYCTGLTIAGGGWRLPHIMELQSIVDETRTGPAIDLSFFPGVPTEDYPYFWSASFAGGSPTLGWSVYFGYGATNSPGTAGDFRARCVR